MKHRSREASAKQYISDDLKAFIKEQIHTVFRLEVLLLLHRERSRSFTAAEVAQELGFEKDVAQEQLRSLAEANLVQPNADETKYRYQPANAGLESIVDELAEAYSKQRVSILSLILNDCPDRTRIFAEAFRLS